MTITAATTTVTMAANAIVAMTTAAAAPVIILMLLYYYFFYYYPTTIYNPTSAVAMTATARTVIMSAGLSPLNTCDAFYCLISRQL